MVRHKVMVASLAVVALGTLAACGRGIPTSQPPQAVTTTAPPSTTSDTASNPPSTATQQPESAKDDPTPRCSAATLKGTVEQGNAAAGNRYAKLVATNTGKAPCTLYGYGGLQLTDSASKATPTKLTRKPNPAPALVTLRPGQKAFKNLHWSVVPDGNEPVTGPCEPASAGASVIPPDETQPFTVKFDFGSVCEEGSVDGSAYYK
jgi:predicted small lipoprotein YifL